MKTSTLIFVSLLLSQMASAKSTLNYECIDEDGYEHEIKIVNNRVFKTSQVTVKLDKKDKIKFKEDLKISVVNPYLYSHWKDGQIKAQGTYEKQTFSKTSGLGVLKSKVDTHTLYLEDKILKGENGQIHYTLATSINRLTGKIFGYGRHESTKAYHLDCSRALK